jgi:hypothetical protein
MENATPFPGRDCLYSANWVRASGQTWLLLSPEKSGVTQSAS